MFGTRAIIFGAVEPIELLQVIVFTNRRKCNVTFVVCDICQGIFLQYDNLSAAVEES